MAYDCHEPMTPLLSHHRQSEAVGDHSWHRSNFYCPLLSFLKFTHNLKKIIKTNYKKNFFCNQMFYSLFFSRVSKVIYEVMVIIIFICLHRFSLHLRFHLLKVVSAFQKIYLSNLSKLKDLL